MDSADICLGRQSISFGSSRFVNPLDVLTSFRFDTIDKEERSGVDAIRLKFFFGEMGEIDTGCVFGDSFKPENSAAYLNTKFLINDSDYTFMVMVFKENLLLGTDFQTSILDAEYWLEAGTFLATGKKSSVNYESGEIIPGSEFGLYQDVYFFSLRFYF